MGGSRWVRVGLRILECAGEGGWKFDGERNGFDRRAVGQRSSSRIAMHVVVQTGNKSL